MSSTTSQSVLRFVYYPGCSLEGVNREYDESLRAVCDRLGIELIEFPAWICCGGSSAHSVEPALGELLVTLNIALASRTGHPLLMPCAACYRNFRQVQQLLACGSSRILNIEKKVEEADPQVRDAVTAGGTSADHRRQMSPLDAVAPQPDGNSESDQQEFDSEFLSAYPICHISQFFRHPEVRRRLREAVVRPLNWLKPVAYYGCLVPRTDARFGSPQAENPTAVDELLEDLGADVRDWAYKTECCGGSLGVTRPAVVRRLISDLLQAAHRAGANCIVTDCPMCFTNLDSRQPEVCRDGGKLTPLPVFYPTELVAIALRIPDALRWLERHCVDTLPLLEEAGVFKPADVSSAGRENRFHPATNPPLVGE